MKGSRQLCNPNSFDMKYSILAVLDIKIFILVLAVLECVINGSRAENVSKKLRVFSHFKHATFSLKWDFSYT